MTTHVVVGGQFGSEAKGHVAAQIVRKADLEHPHHLNACVRVNGPNAGHSVKDDRGRVWAFRTIPVAAPISNMDLFIAAGSEIDIEVLKAEIDLLLLDGIDVRPRLYIDRQATVISQANKDAEADLGLQSRVGSTAKGIGAARSERIWRRASTVDSYGGFERYGIVCDTGEILRRRSRMAGASVIVEGTQGYGLGLHAGWYPYCTSADCRSIDFLAAAGLAPVRTQTLSWVVFRTFPIRVAGNSGPMFDEITFGQLADESGGYIQPEYTTVTKKLRRIGRWDANLARQAIDANGGASNPDMRTVLTFVDYLDPALAGCTDFDTLRSSKAWRAIDAIEREQGVGFSAFTTGAGSIVWRNR